MGYEWIPETMSDNRRKVDTNEWHLNGKIIDAFYIVYIQISDVERKGGGGVL